MQQVNPVISEQAAITICKRNKVSPYDIDVKFYIQYPVTICVVVDPNTGLALGAGTSKKSRTDEWIPERGQAKAFSRALKNVNEGSR